MKKREFLQKLREYLSYELPESIVRTKVQFYSDYIDSEAAEGKSVEDVTEDLGDPQLIARSIIDAEKSGPDGIPGTGDDRNFAKEMYGESGSGQTGSDQGSGYGGFGSGGSSSRSGFGNSGYGTSGGSGYGNSEDVTGSSPFGSPVRFYNFGCFSGVLIFLIIFCVFSIIGALLGALSPILAPVLMVVLILWLLGRTKGGSW